ncbi:hypothetical protein RHS01_09231 [Rhizoctonia solani]|uniref:Uncharacterized protein n=1 Tax=Rhizoctonia solani TaxID=456999 RepID=A0A8H7I985_9AGAM|nr:hypothetical protein RHS01_09231 [Rhizoctonia solani]
MLGAMELNILRSICIPNGLIEGFTDSPPPTKRSLKLLANSSPSSPQTALATTPDASDLAAAVASTNLSLGVLRARTLKPGNVLPLRLIQLAPSSMPSPSPRSAEPRSSVQQEPLLKSSPTTKRASGPRFDSKAVKYGTLCSDASLPLARSAIPTGNTATWARQDAVGG